MNLLLRFCSERNPNRIWKIPLSKQSIYDFIYYTNVYPIKWLTNRDQNGIKKIIKKRIPFMAAALHVSHSLFSISPALCTLHLLLPNVEKTMENVSAVKYKTVLGWHRGGVVRAINA